MGAARANNGVGAVDRALRILLTFRQGDRSLSLAEIARRTGMYKSTILRLAATLGKHGCLVRASDGSFRLGHALLYLGFLYRNALRMDDVIVPALHDLMRLTGESARFFVRHGDLRVCLFSVDSPEPLREHLLPGEARPLDATATGQVFARMAARAPMPSPAFPVYTAGIRDPLTASCAAPLVTPEGVFLGVVTVSGPTARFARKRKAATRTLREVVGKLSGQLAGAPPIS